MDIVTHQKTLYTSKNPTRRWLHTSRRDWILSAIQRYSPTHRNKAIEVGPGSGLYLPELLNLFKQVVAFDIEDQYLQAARSMLPENKNLFVKVGDITNHQQLESGTFDLVLCTEVLEHIPPEKSDQAIKGLRRLISNDGILILSTPHRWSSLETIARIALSPIGIYFTRIIYREPVLEMGHINLLTRTQVRSALTKAGFEIIEEYASGLYIPIVAELFGGIGLKFERKMEKLIRGSTLHQLLWTQYYIARPQTQFKK